ncbi:MAG TPA: uL30 family ribosomal protein [Candidatus Nanoarchaeia archaeon]|nr:uL30 family ribosomal protein [Candidatus Nanoarchaeia archaeon]
MICVIRIKGQVGLNKDVKETLNRLKIRRKFAARVFENPSAVEIGMINRVRNFVSFGEISTETHKKLIDARGQMQKNKSSTSPSKESRTKDNEGKLKPFFRLHPPRGGANMKLHYPKGVLGENKKMDELIQKML